MEFTKEISQRLTEYLKQDNIKKTCINLGIFSENDSLLEMLDKTKKYINDSMRGKFIGDKATEKFFKVIKYYSTNEDFERFSGDKYIPDGFIKCNLVLPIVTNSKKQGFRVLNDILGFDGKKYIVKNAEGLRGVASGKKNGKDARYNPTVAYALFKFLGQPCARNLPACEKLPYFYILSENFLKDNEKIYGLDAEEFMDTELVIDENNNITHKQIINGIEETVRNKNLSPSKMEELCKKLKLQYAIQETLKCLICSMDENLGNTSLIVTSDDNGEIQDINISPAYDLDLSFNLGEEILKILAQKEVIYRTTTEGKTDLTSIINEFETIEGYKEALQEIKNRLNGNYINQIFDIAYKEAKVDELKKRETIDKFGNFIMRRVASLKEACKETADRGDKTKN